MKNVLQLQKNITDFIKIHHQFHYKESDDFFYLGVIYYLESDAIAANKHFINSIFHFPEHKDAEQMLQILNRDTNITSFRYHSRKLHIENGKIDCYLNVNPDIHLEELKIDQIKLSTFIKLSENRKIKEMLLDSNKITKSKHLTYHLKLAKMYHELSNAYKRLGFIHEAIYFLEKALETEKTNCSNEVYRNEIKALIELKNA